MLKPPLNQELQYHHEPFKMAERIKSLILEAGTFPIAAKVSGRKHEKGQPPAQFYISEQWSPPSPPSPSLPPHPPPLSPLSQLLYDSSSASGFALDPAHQRQGGTKKTQVAADHLETNQESSDAFELSRQSDSPGGHHGSSLGLPANVFTAIVTGFRDKKLVM
ncbi:hypothetical protein JZ751_003961 [Albula glossodonta]|uniref:Uncharacterized protein n=1 Tax=Albula glossodonta TaxID=121402 RepID=A0A8T2P5Y6_9TELE|nr:hypothetical protein JZ751_003961 [Albula glossodonta]